MWRTCMFLMLLSLVVVGIWPVRGIAEELSAIPGLSAPLEQEAPAAATVNPGFGSSTLVSGLMDPRGIVAFPPLTGFPCCYFIAEHGRNRIAVAANGSIPLPFATVTTPTDLVAPPGAGGPFGNFLYAIDATNNTIVSIDKTGAVQVFVSFASTPQRLAFTPSSPGTFGTFLFVTLADGQLVKVAPDKTVTPCASGLSGPTGLAFGPGGGAFKTTLFVAEATANRISKVNASCTVTSFAASGLTTPGTLALSPGGAWGPLDTLYVVNGTTQVVTVDKNATVKPFASGFTGADTAFLAPWGFVPPDHLQAGARLLVSDATAGTLEEVFVRVPFATFQLVGCNPCHVGDRFAMNFTVGNPSPLNVRIELKAGFRFPDGTPVYSLPLVNDKHATIEMPKGFSFSAPLFPSFPVPPIPPGSYCYEVGVSDPELFPFNGVIANARTCFAIVP